ncbi:hypothetical protein [Streptomyces sp. NPDC050504]|uniref:hypothetical protein n=1 Tax=Streptomyces sp. NPDC050504 TaxID=3365618 RepID=UPI00379F08F9
MTPLALTAPAGAAAGPAKGFVAVAADRTPFAAVEDLQLGGKQPAASRVAPDGRIWVPEVGAAQIEILDDEGKKILGRVSFPQDPLIGGKAPQPRTVAFEADGTAWVLFANATGAVGRVAADGTFDKYYDVRTGDEQDTPSFRDVVVEPGGRVWLSDEKSQNGPGRLVYFDAENPETTKKQLALGGGKQVKPTMLALDAERKKLLVTLSGTGANVLPGMAVVDTAAATPTSRAVVLEDPSHVHNLLGIALLGGKAWISSEQGNWIRPFDYQGESPAFGAPVNVPSGLSAPRALMVAEGQLWVAAYGRGGKGAGVFQMDPSGRVENTLRRDDGSAVYAVNALKSGRIGFTDYLKHTYSVYTAALADTLEAAAGMDGFAEPGGKEFRPGPTVTALKEGVPVEGAQVTFTVQQGDPTGSYFEQQGAQTRTAVVTTNARGEATAPLRSGAEDGSFTVIAEAAGVARPVSFRETVGELAAPTDADLSGSGQYAIQGERFTEPLALTLSNTKGPIKNVSVSFSVDDGAHAQFLLEDGSSSTTVRVTTDNRGRATAPPLIAGTGKEAKGEFSVTVGSPAVARPLQAVGTVTGKPVDIHVDDRGADLDGTPGETLSHAGLVLADADGDPVPGFPVTFVSTDPEQVYFGTGAAYQQVRTNAKGEAVVGTDNGIDLTVSPTAEPGRQVKLVAHANSAEGEELAEFTITVNPTF